MAFAQIVAQIMYARVFDNIPVSRKSIFFVGALTIILQSVGFGLAGLYTDLYSFIIVIACIQIIGGIGQGFITATVIATLSSFKSSEREKFTG